MADLPGNVIWMRDQRRTSRRWWRWAMPVVIVLCGGMAVGSVVADDGGDVSFFLGMGAIGIFLMVLGPWLMDRIRRTNAVVTSDGTQLYWSKHAVPLGAVASWTAGIVSSSVSSGGPTVRTSAYNVNFVLTDGSRVGFTFPYLDEEEGLTLRAAIAAQLPHLTPTN